MSTNGGAESIHVKSEQARAAATRLLTDLEAEEAAWEQQQEAYVDEEALPGANGNGANCEPRLANLVEEISSTILKYLELEAPELAALLAIWVVQSYAIETFSFAGFLSVQSASPRCGKSRLLEILGCFTRDVTPLRTMPSPAVLFRTTDQVLFLDEVEGLKNADKEKFGEIMSLLNMAFKRGGVVERCEKNGKDGWVVKKYPAYRAIGMAGLSTLSDSLSDRSFHIRMKRTIRKMPRLNIGKLEVEAQPVRDKLALWWASNGEELAEIYVALPDETGQLKGYDDRLQDIAEPLLVLAGVADRETGTNPNPIIPRFLKAMKLVAVRRAPSGIEENLKTFLALIEPRLGDVDEVFVPSHDLVDMCREADGLEWIETPRRLKGFLSKFDLYPKNQSGKVRGYVLSREWMKEWGQRYA